jgi:hypothetical protein
MYNPKPLLSKMVTRKIKKRDCFDTWNVFTELHGVTSERTVVLIPTAVRISNRNPPHHKRRARL